MFGCTQHRRLNNFFHIQLFRLSYMTLHQKPVLLKELAFKHLFLPGARTCGKGGQMIYGATSVQESDQIRKTKEQNMSEENVLVESVVWGAAAKPQEV